MTILYICNEYPPGKSGGIGTVTQMIARGMSANGHNVLVAGLYMPGFGGADQEEDEGIRIWRKRLKVDKGWIRNNYSVWDTLILKSLSASGILKSDIRRSFRQFNRFIIELIEQFKIDIIEWPDYNQLFEYLEPPLAFPEWNIPLIIKFHGTRSYILHRLQEQVSKRLYALEKEHILSATAHISVSRDTAENYSQFYELSTPIHILYNSIEPPPYKYDAGLSTKKIVFTGALSKLKGIYSLVAAWKWVREEYKDATLEIFGKGKFNKIATMAEPAVRKSIHHKGFVTKEELYDAMSTAAASIFPSYTECFALAPLEAMAAGCPVIYTERASGPELINHGLNGLLIDPDNPRQMAEAMIRLISDKTLREKFSLNGRQTIEAKFTADRSVADHIALYDQVIRDFKKNPSIQ